MYFVKKELYKTFRETSVIGEEKKALKYNNNKM